MLSIIIPSRSPQYLKKTVNDLLVKAEDEIEVIVVLDGVWPEDFDWGNKRVRVIHYGTIHDSGGMRRSINLGMSLANGEYVMKIDEHCMVDQGYDVKLRVDCENNWLIIPRRYRLLAEEWEIQKDKRPPVDYMSISYPYERPQDKTCGLHGAEWKQRYYDRKDILIDDTPSFQGSCYFMKKKLWEDVIVKMDDEAYGPFTQEAQELGMKIWLSGGRVVVNKKTWYAHMHKGKMGKGYGFSKEQYLKHSEWNERGRLYCINYWLYTKDYKYNWDWFMKKFPDMPGWGNDWKERIEKDKELDYSTTKYKNDYWLQNLQKEYNK